MSLSKSLRGLLTMGAVALGAIAPRAAWAQAVIKVACIGEHTTHSHHLDFAQEYPAHLQTLLRSGYEVKNFGDGVGMLTTGYPPGDYMEYVKSVGYMQSLTYPADIVVFGPWGKHDSVATGGYDPAVNKLDPAKFKAAYETLLQTYIDLPSHPKVLLALPIPFPFGAPTGPLTTIVLPTVKDVAASKKLPTFDLYNLFLNQKDDYKDLDHLTDETVRAYAGSGQEMHVKAVRDALMTLGMATDAGVSAASDAGAGGGKPGPVTMDAASQNPPSSMTAGAGGSGGAPVVGGASGSAMEMAGSAPSDTPSDGATSDGTTASGCSCAVVGKDSSLSASLIIWFGAGVLGARRRRRASSEL
jgi:MYXO-CTERM domain-containing protein